MPNLINKILIENIYTNIVKTSRNKNFFLAFKVDDTVEGRFDIIILHSFIVFQFFLYIGQKKSDLSQMLFDHMFADFDNNLREMGFGDIAVNKRMKQFIKAFYGRISNYSKSQIQFEKMNDDTMLKNTILRNIYKGKDPGNESINFWKNYIVDNIKYINDNTLDKNIINLFSFKSIEKW